jgi:hypothetical protein
MLDKEEISTTAKGDVKRSKMCKEKDESKGIENFSLKGSKEIKKRRKSQRKGRVRSK